MNVENNAAELFERFSYFNDKYHDKINEAEIRKEEKIEIETTVPGSGWRSFSTTFPSFELRNEARWYGTAAIEAFFSWTEHVFILIAILRGKIATGEDVAKISGLEWKEKFKLALDITCEKNKEFYDKLTTLRSQVRNFVAHGAFGKNGEALSFHSKIGAVPLLLPHRESKQKFKFGNGVNMLLPDSINLISSFINYMWNGSLSPAKIYIDSSLPLILSHVKDGKYSLAMNSEEDMEYFTRRLVHLFDDAANMDW